MLPFVPLVLVLGAPKHTPSAPPSSCPSDHSGGSSCLLSPRVCILLSGFSFPSTIECCCACDPWWTGQKYQGMNNPWELSSADDLRLLFSCVQLFVTQWSTPGLPALHHLMEFVKDREAWCKVGGKYLSSLGPSKCRNLKVYVLHWLLEFPQWDIAQVTSSGSWIDKASFFVPLPYFHSIIPSIFPKELFVLKSLIQGIFLGEHKLRHTCKH